MSPKLPTNQQMIAAARQLHQEDGHLEIDDNAVVSRSEDNEAEGAYVQAWLWIDDEEAWECAQQAEPQAAAAQSQGG